MTKTFHFMAGLPRSGSTVLSAILNQNPEIYSSPQTDLLGVLYNLEREIPNYESYKAGLLHEGFRSVLYKVADNFYSHINKPVVIDKNRGWGTPYNMDNLRLYVNPNGKFILTLRPILEILASYVKVLNASEKATGIAQFHKPESWVSIYRSQTDAQIENIMAPYSDIDRSLYSISNLLKNYGDQVYVVWYNDLLDAPQKTMDGITDFLEIKRFDYNFDRIEQVDKHDDISGYGIKGLHDTKKKLTASGIKPEDYLSPYIIDKYKGTLDFLWS
jgi:sulfotransferase